MPKFEKLEEAQAAHDRLEGDVSELKKTVAKLNSENAQRRKHEDDLTGELDQLRKSGQNAAEKAAEEKLAAQHKEELAKVKAEGDEKVRQLTLERAALAAGVKSDEIEAAVKLLPGDVKPGEERGAFAEIVKKHPTFAGDPPAAGPDDDPGGKGAPDGFALKSGKPVDLDKYRENRGQVFEAAQRKKADTGK